MRCLPVSANMGHWRPGRTGGMSGHVGYAAESGSRFRALAAAGPCRPHEVTACHMVPVGVTAVVSN